MDIRVDNVDEPKKMTVTFKGAIGLTVSVLIFSAFGEGEAEAEIEITDASKNAGAVSVPNLWENPSDAVWQALKVLIFNLMGKQVPTKEAAFVKKMTTAMTKEYPTILAALGPKGKPATNAELATKLNDAHRQFLLATCKATHAKDASNPFNALNTLQPKVLELMTKLKKDQISDKDVADMKEVKRTHVAAKDVAKPPADSELCSWTFRSGYYTPKCAPGYAADGYCNCAPEISALNSQVSDAYEKTLFTLWAKLNMNYDNLESTPDCKKLLDEAKGPIKNAEAHKVR